MSEKREQILCNFCPNKSLYTCPSCNVPYCSSKCYKCQRHVKCSEMFYKGMVEEELKGCTASEDSKKKMYKILKKMEAEDGTMGEEEEKLDSDDDEEISERMKGIDLDDSDVVWSKLSETEKHEFLDLIQGGKTAEIIPEWEAWWEKNYAIAEVGKGGKHVPSFMESCPPVLERPLLSQIMKSEPSPCIPCNVLNVLAAYVWTVRIFNGDHHDDCIDATEAVFTLCPVLSGGSNFSSAEIAIRTAKVEAQNYPWLNESEEFSAKVEEDVRLIAKGPSASFPSFYVASALSDLHALFVASKKTLTRKSKKQTGVFSMSFAGSNQEIPKKFTKPELVNVCIKKLDFFLSFTKEYPAKLSL